MALPSTVDNKDEPQYSTQDEAEAAFIKLLRRSGVGADWTWEQTMRAVIKEPQYRALKDPKDRKAAFEKFTTELRAHEVEKAKDRMTKLRQDFSTMLKSHPEIKYYTRWKYVYLIFIPKLVPSNSASGLLNLLSRKKQSLGQPLTIMNAASCLMNTLLSFGKLKLNARLQPARRLQKN